LIDATPPDHPEFSQIVHQCPEMRAAIALAQRFATRDVPVLIHGETGTGKELFARAIHQASPRRNGPFVAVNCGALAEELIDAELFGYEKGAFTGAATSKAGYFETAHFGTLFLDEVAELPLRSQVRLLRVLQEGEVNRVGATRPTPINVRIIAASHRDLMSMSSASTFREDLYYRLAVAELRLPPLRERQGDITMLIESLLNDVNYEAQRLDSTYVSKTLHPRALAKLIGQSWPGNVRELRNVLIRATIWASSDQISASEIDKASYRQDSGKSKFERSLLPIPSDFSLQKELHEVAGHYLEKAMSESGGNKSQAASKLGLKSHQVLTSWLKKYTQ